MTCFNNLKICRLLYFVIIISILYSINLFAAEVTLKGSLTREYIVNKGELIEGTVVLKNDGEQPAEVRIYQNDYYPTIDGTKYLNPDYLERSNSTWIKFNPDNNIIIPAKSEYTISYTINVPKTPLKGTYWSMLMIELLHPKQKVSVIEKEDEIAIGLQHIIRYAVQFRTHIKNTGKKSLKIIKRRLIKKDGVKRLEVQLENTGNLWVKLKSTLELFDDSGSRCTVFKGPLSGLYPGTISKITIPLKNIQSGTYQGLLILDGGGDQLWGAQYTMRL